MRVIWTRIENWLANNAPEILMNLNSGATDEEIASTEEFLGISFLDDFKDSYRLHNGQRSYIEAPDQQQIDYYCLMDMWQLLSLARIKEEWSCWKELLDDGKFDDSNIMLDDSVETVWWNTLWIPLTSDFCGDHHCLDLSLSLGGSEGQIVMMWHDLDTREIVAPSFKAWLESFADDLEAGHYAFDPTIGQVIDLRLEEPLS